MVYRKQSIYYLSFWLLVDICVAIVPCELNTFII